MDLRSHRALPRLAAAGAAVALLLTGCGGDGDTTTGGGATPAEPARSEPAAPKPAEVETALRAQLEAGLGQVAVTSIACTSRGTGFTCSVKAVSAGQPRSGRLSLEAQGGERRFVASGRLAGSGGNIKLSGLVVDLDQPAPEKPAGPPGRSPLEQAIEAALEQSNPQLIITRLKCPEQEQGSRGARFTCRAKGPYGVSPATVVIRVTQTDSAAKRFVLSGTIDFTDPTGRSAHGTFQDVKVVVP